MLMGYIIFLKISVFLTFLMGSPRAHLACLLYTADLLSLITPYDP